MRTEKIQEAIRLLRSRAVREQDPSLQDLTSGADEELAALSAAPEDVARDVETVGAVLAKARKRAGMAANAKDESREVEDGQHALSRLASAAARVPGLEAEAAGVRRALNCPMDAPLVEWARACDDNRKRAEARHLAAESERDEARAALECKTEALVLAGERDAAEQRVAELERQVDAGAALLAEASDLESRATAAEARARMLELRCCSVGRSVACTCAGHWVCDVHGDQHEPGPKPSPAPGLREAVGPLADAVRLVAPTWEGQSDTVVFWSPRVNDASERVTLGDFRRILAAYDGTAPDAETTWTLEGHNAKGALDRERATIAALNEAGVPPGVERQRGIVSHFPADRVRWLAEKAAKWDAAVERVNSSAFTDRFAHAVGGPAMRALAAARWALGLDAASAPDDTLPKARVVEVLTDMANEDNVGKEDPESAMAEAHSDGWTACALKTLERLGLTLDAPTGSGGGEAKKCACTLEDCDNTTTRACGRCDFHCGHARGVCAEPTPTARIAPAPTPTGPVLAEPSDHETWCTCSKCKNGAYHPDEDAQPEPAAPEVERDGVRVLEDGTCLVSLWGEWRPTTDKTKRVLARALAEARREREVLVEAVLTAAAESAHAEVFKVYGDTARAKQVAEAVMDVDLSALGLPLESP